MDYNEFLQTKITKIQDAGFEVQEMNKNLFDFQKHIVKKALKKGRYAIFADCGLGKTLMQLEFANQVAKHTNKPVLILCPLAVAQQTINEAIKFGLICQKYNQNIENGKVYISNYEQLDNIDTEVFSGIVLDESSILKNFTGKYKNLIIDKFKTTPYKLACTATPAPNDPMELGNHSEFLNVMSRNEMLSMYFIHDGGETSKWRLKGHSKKRFYNFVSEWAVVINKPSDIGFNDDGFILPKLNIQEKMIISKNKDNTVLFNKSSVSALEFNQELKNTKIERLDKVVELVNNSKDNFIIWIKQNEEGEYLRKYIKDAVEVKGSDTPEYKENKLIGFANNEFRVLITKTKIAQFGLNYQNCNNQIFASLDFSFEGLYQAIRRSYRFGQKKEVNIYLITTDTMQNVVKSINKKQKDYMEMKNIMSENIKYSNDQKKYDVDNVDNIHYRIYNGDCVTEIKNIGIGEVDFAVFSPPFAELYTYSDKIEDMGNSKDYKEFLKQFDFLVKELKRVLKKGRNVAVHCMDLPIQKGKEGYIGLRDFSNMIREVFEKNKFIYHSRITIWKDPVIEMQRTKALGLLHKQVKKDSVMSRVGLPDYILVFRNEGDNEIPIQNTNMSVDLWQKYASPVWFDINYSNTLQGWRNGRDEQDEKHICPLQLDTIERLIALYSNKGEKVLTPFMGIGSEVYQAVKMDRYGIGIELKESYYEVAKRNLSTLLEQKQQVSLF